MHLATGLPPYEISPRFVSAGEKESCSKGRGNEVTRLRRDCLRVVSTAPRRRTRVSFVILLGAFTIGEGASSFDHVHGRRRSTGSGTAVEVLEADRRAGFARITEVEQ